MVSNGVFTEPQYAQFAQVHEALYLCKAGYEIFSEIELPQISIVLHILERGNMVNRKRQHLKSSHLIHNRYVVQVVSPQIQVLYTLYPVGLGLHVDQLNR